jgi:hypothetical protein
MMRSHGLGCQLPNEAEHSSIGAPRGIRRQLCWLMPDGGGPELAETPRRDLWAELVQALLRWEESDEMSLSQDADLDAMAREVDGWDTNPASTEGERRIPALIAELKASRKVIRAARKLVEQLSTLYIEDEPLIAALAELDSRS